MGESGIKWEHVGESGKLEEQNISHIRGHLPGKKISKGMWVPLGVCSGRCPGAGVLDLLVGLMHQH